ncbi:TPA: capsular polysaccharide biosynthesis protein, partial [Pasteurella multocida]|nr:capsular polysaccharide biosynthesis protein [Pasteurella multocida]
MFLSSLGLYKKRRYLKKFMQPTENVFFFFWGKKHVYREWFVRNILRQKIAYLEDGFIRSHFPGKEYPTLSIIIDKIGIYYDSTNPSELENQLNNPHFTYNIEGKVYTKQEVEVAIELIKNYKISKYSYLKDIDPNFFLPCWKHKKKILIVDQTFGDKSINYAQASDHTFLKMLEIAKLNNPNAIFIIKSHPEVEIGEKEGHFSSIVESEQVKFLYDTVNPYSLLDHIDEVYVVSSTLGFEALLAGKKVHCFGIPWYSNWGVTTDYFKCTRRKQKRTIAELFFAAYFRYTRYINPITKEKGDIFDVINWLILQKEISTRYNNKIIALGFRKWKQSNLTPLLSFNKNKLFFIQNISELNKSKIAINNNDMFVIWGNKIPSELTIFAEKYSAKIVRMEDGFIRSVGLGSNFIPPNSFVLDKRGLYFDPTTQSDLEFLLENHEITESELLQAQKIRKLILEHNITKYNVEKTHTPTWNQLTQGKTTILIPGQVEDDASILFGSPKIKTNLELLQLVRAENPNAFIVYKPHPDVLAKNRIGKLDLSILKKFVNYIEQDLSIIACINYCDEVHTMTSLAGFDALLRNKKVITYGMPFYSGWGLTIDKHYNPLRTKKRSLDELIAISLNHYPIYWDHELKGYTNSESVIYSILSEIKMNNNYKTHNMETIKIIYQ